MGKLWRRREVFSRVSANGFEPRPLNDASACGMDTLGRDRPRGDAHSNCQCTASDRRQNRLSWAHRTRLDVTRLADAVARLVPIDPTGSPIAYDLTR